MHSFNYQLVTKNLRTIEKIILEVLFVTIVREISAIN